MNLLGDLGTEYGKQATEAVVTGNDFGVQVGEAPINEVAGFVNLIWPLLIF